jgi:hypothetical protein
VRHWLVSHGLLERTRRPAGALIARQEIGSKLVCSSSDILLCLDPAVAAARAASSSEPIAMVEQRAFDRKCGDVTSDPQQQVEIGWSRSLIHAGDLQLLDPEYARSQLAAAPWPRR